MTHDMSRNVLPKGLHPRLFFYYIYICKLKIKIMKSNLSTYKKGMKLHLFFNLLITQEPYELL